MRLAAQVVAPPPAAITPLVEKDAVLAGETVRAALVVRLPDGFHANANKPRDPSLIPMTVAVATPTGVTATEVVFPQASDFKVEGFDDLLRVFEGEFVIGVELAVASGVSAGDVTVPVSLRYQACNDKMCFVPKTIAAEWTLRIANAGSAKSGHPDVFSRIAFGTGEKPADGLRTTAPPPPDVTSQSQQADSAGLDGFTIRGTTGGYLGTEDFLQFVRDAEAGVRRTGMFEGRGPLAILLLVFAGGLALNLTPCVLPMIPINLAIIGAGTRSGSRGRGFLLGASYGAAMAVVYGVLGLIVILTASTFGTINASPWFNLGIALLFVVLALAMFDVLVIDFSRFSTRFQVDSGGRGSLLVAFFMGGVAALLAGACVAPIVIQVVLFSSTMYASGTSAALALPFILGLGMALPWPIAGAGVAALPKPGAWMVRIKQVFGVVILGRRTPCSPTAGWIRMPSPPAYRSSSSPDGMPRSRQDSRRPRVNASRCSSTSGPRGARTAWPWTSRRSKMRRSSRRSTAT
jgi:cytochrome c biogenesis protein CcdA